MSHTDWKVIASAIILGWKETSAVYLFIYIRLKQLEEGQSWHWFCALKDCFKLYKIRISFL